jgi:hypothetical protein
MLLRRLSQHIHDQNWFAVGLDFIVVVAGIFVGLQVNDWNQNRKDGIEGRAYLERIGEDIRADLTDLSRVLPGVSRKQDALIILDNAANENMPERDAAEVFSAIQESTSFGWHVPWVRRSTFEDLVSTGRLALVREARLRTQIQDYYSQASNRMDRINTRITGYATHVYKFVDADDFSGYLAQSEERLAVAEDQPVRMDGVIDFLEAARDADLDDLINAERNYATFLSLMVEEQLKDAEELLGVLGNYLGATDNP